MIAPFVLLLASMALAPSLWPAWWARHYPKVACGLGAITAGYYLFGLHAPQRLLHVGHDYLSFIALIGSLFIVSGGIHISVKGEATPHVNTAFLFAGALAANLLGTTGASMLLIRPWIRMNQYRITAYHVVFFIFLVSNVGGCLTPIGDPPLFLGYLKGIPFWWVTRRCWPMWAVAVGLLLAAFYVLDSMNYRRAPREVRREVAGPPEQWRFDGLGNLVWLTLILVAVFISRPPFLREALMVAAAAASYFTTEKSVHEANHFSFHPIQEVAILFAGIFATMIPALDWLQRHAGSFGTPTPGLFYWGSGLLSSTLDNAPTYLSFLSALVGLFVSPETVDQVQMLIQGQATGTITEPIRRAFEALQQHYGPGLAGATIGPEEIKAAFLLANNGLDLYVVAISVGAVFFGAFTYIGNGPNFMVKAIAEHRNVRTPGFLCFIGKYSLPYLAPVLVIIWLLFFRRF